jgi:hypothetical protein
MRTMLIDLIDLIVPKNLGYHPYNYDCISMYNWTTSLLSCLVATERPLWCCVRVLAWEAGQVHQLQVGFLANDSCIIQMEVS